MTSIHYLAGWSVDARQELLEKKLSSWKGGAILHLVPTRGRVIELESDRRFWPLKRQDTLTGLIYKIFEENIGFGQFKGSRQIDDHVRALVVRKAMERRASQPDGLTYFNRLFDGGFNDFPGILRAICDFFSKLIQNNYQDRFVNDLEGRILRAEERGDLREGHYALESDLAWIFGDYEEIKKEIHAYDGEDVLSSVRGFLGAGHIPSPLHATDVIVFDGFINLSRIEEDILFYLFHKVKEVWWLIDYDGRADDPVQAFMDSSLREKGSPGRLDAYGIFTSTASFMARLAKAGINALTEKSPNARFQNPVAEGLYLDGQLRSTDTNNLKIRYFIDRSDEIKAIAAEIKRIIHDDNLDISSELGRIRIIFPELKEYSSLISETFKRYGIPFSLTSGLPLLAHPLANIFLLLFKLPLNRFKREDVFRLFSSGLIRKMDFHGPCDNEESLNLIKDNLISGDDIAGVKGLIMESGATVDGLMDIDFIDRVIRRCGIKYLDHDNTGEDKTLSIVRDYYDGRLANAGLSVERERLRREYYRFVRHYVLLSDNMNSLRLIISQHDPHDIAEAYLTILKDLGLPANILTSPESNDLSALSDTGMIARDIKAFSMLKKIVYDSASELTLDNELFQSRSGRELLSGFFRIFRKRLEYSYLLDEQDPNVIRISQWLEIRGRSFDYVFAGGLTDKGFPLKDETNFVYPETAKDAFRLPDNMDMSSYLLSHLLRNCRNALYLSSHLHGEEKEVRPSNAFTDIESILDKGLPSGKDADEIKRSFIWDDSPYLSSEDDLLDASIRGTPENLPAERPFPTKNVIIKDKSHLEGILRGLNATGSRWALNGLFEYDGLIGKALTFKGFLESRSEVFSASQLDSLANCPMRYLFERVYDLKPMDVSGPDASPMEMGDHIHKVLSIFFRRLRDKGKNVPDIGLKQAFSQAMDTTDEYFKSLPFLENIEFFEYQKRELLEGLDAYIKNGIDASTTRDGIFAMLLRFEEENFRDRAPEGIEYEFGFNDTPCPRMGKVNLRGVIDRFDVDRKDKERFHIYDYKTGTMPSPALIKKGLSFQLPVYIRALKTCLNAKNITASLYSLKKDYLFRKSPLGQLIYDNAETDLSGLDITGILILDGYADRLMGLIEEGRFHHSTDMIKCEYCDFRYACHRDERRMARLVASGDDHGIYSGEKNLGRWKDADNFMAEWKKTRESMNKAFNLKTPSGRKTHYESVISFGQKLLETGYDKILGSEYLNKLAGEIEDFKKRYMSSIA